MYHNYPFCIIKYHHATQLSRPIRIPYEAPGPLQSPASATQALNSETEGRTTETRKRMSAKNKNGREATRKSLRVRNLCLVYALQVFTCYFVPRSRLKIWLVVHSMRKTSPRFNSINTLPKPPFSALIRPTVRSRYRISAEWTFSS